MGLLYRWSIIVVLTAGCVAVATPALAGPPGHWTQITHAHSGAKANLGLARDTSGTLHVFWAGPKFRPFTSMFDTTIAPSGVVGSPQAILSDWSGLLPPAAVATPDGSIHVVVSGQKVYSNDDPNAGLNEIVGPGSWKLGAHAFGSYSISEASNADVRIAARQSGQLVVVWTSAGKILFQTGVDPSTQSQNITPNNDPVGSVEVAVDRSADQAIMAYRGASSGLDYFQQILPNLGSRQAMPQAKVDTPTIAARSTGGVYSAYTPDGTRVVLLQYGGGSTSVPVPKNTQVLTAGLAAGPEGRLWIYYGNIQSTCVTRTNRSVSRFEPVQRLASPPGAVQYFRLEGDGSAGPLDLFADVTVDGQAKDGSYHQQVWPVLSLSVAKTPLKNKRGKVTAVRVTVRVDDAGDGVGAATVKGLPAGARSTDANGLLTFTVPAGKRGVYALRASKAGYVAAKGKLSL